MPHALVELGGLRGLLSRLQERPVRLGAGERNHAAAVHTQHTPSAPSPRKLKHATAEKQKKKNLSIRTCYTCSSARACRRVLAVRSSDNRSSERSPLTQCFLPLHHVSAAAPPQALDHTKVGSGLWRQRSTFAARTLNHLSFFVFKSAAIYAQRKP